ncbi:MAG TPA: hypothetical protein VL614_21165 [Acetobacteraceae bacterium]|jgi:hypothetical protein|nr:hypothetical protein [Acetobacteraceae bacterium]
MTTLAKLMGSAVPAAQAQATTAGVPLLSQTAAGTTQANAYAIVSDFTVFGTVASGSGARLPPANAASLTAQQGDIYVVVNGQATNALLVYPPVGGNFAAVAVNTAVSVPAGKTADFYCLGGNVWAASIGG